jgi:hypothetical protein
VRIPAEQFRRASGFSDRADSSGWRNREGWHETLAHTKGLHPRRMIATPPPLLPTSFNGLHPKANSCSSPYGKAFGRPTAPPIKIYPDEKQLS